MDTRARALKRKLMMDLSLSSQLELKDFEDEDGDLAMITVSRLEEMIQFQRQMYNKNETTNSIVKTLTSAERRDLKLLIFGKRPFPLDWEGQGFVFNSKIPFGLVQKRGGPCGVFAAVQAILLRNLLFGSEYYEDQIFNDLTELTQLQLDKSMNAKTKRKRIPALVAALTEIIWRCGKTNIGAGPDSHGHGPAICFNIAIGGQYRVFDDIEDLRKYIKFHIQQFDCITLVYSIVLSRGIHNVKSDMDFNSPLLAEHGFCTQELINLLIIGTATSNAFDNEIILLGGKVCKGICAQTDIGYLSQHDIFPVGSYLKNPRFPLWIVWSESHFSLLFSNDLRLTNSKHVNHDTFDLYYYDGFTSPSQAHLVRLTIKLNGYSNPEPVVDPCLNGNNNIPEDLIPPLEKCIRTKWKNAGVDWNDTIRPIYS